MKLDKKFEALKADNAPGQEVRKDLADINTIMTGEMLDGIPVDFSHGDVDAFPPTPDSDNVWKKGFDKGGQQAYTEYRGALEIRNSLAEYLAEFTGKPILADNELIITPGTQGALFLALGTTVTNGTKVAVVEPDYFANRKLVTFFGGEIIPIQLNYLGNTSENGLDLISLEKAFKEDTEVFVLSNPNNPTGYVYSESEITKISALAAAHDVTIIVDQLYSRMLYSEEVYTHLCSCNILPENLLTIMGPSKTESLSGFRLGVAFGTSELIDRMERLQAIVSLRAAGYNQAVLNTWLREPSGWMEDRIRQHELIRNELLKVFRTAHIETATPKAGSYLFPKLPPLKVDIHTFVHLLRYQAKVTVTPGTEFAPECNDSIRLNFSQDFEAAISAAKRIVKMVEIYRK
ncbi:MAG: pyridoxal phosphate-dependent aminotransferase [Balneolaceae bacterium]|nr:pyridoxal phosphate-dependent aminotransferase [Balneolaceae bacterium]MBO6546664.1 pyridoxal phosphate-dependent aminotransferase [Balneolaceae bacterium]MBO6649022.1 pyridoxal phosphate-dependent aminotransferase [Balneolaceae bacterium]